MRGKEVGFELMSAQYELSFYGVLWSTANIAVLKSLTLEFGITYGFILTDYSRSDNLTSKARRRKIQRGCRLCCVLLG